MLLHSCPLLFYLNISETPLHSANLNSNLTQNQRNHSSCTMLEMRLGCSSLNYDLHRKKYYSFQPMCLRCRWNRTALSHQVSNISINAWSLHQRFTLCTYSRTSPFRKWSPYTRCKFKLFLKSPGIQCIIKAFWRLAIDPHWCVDIYSSGRRVWQITCACFFLLFLF